MMPELFGVIQNVRLCWAPRTHLVLLIYNTHENMLSRMLMTATHISPTTCVNPSASIISLTFTLNTLHTLRTALIPYAATCVIPGEANAAVLVPLCNVDGVPGVLLELRGGTLRSHASEVRYAWTVARAVSL